MVKNLISISYDENFSEKSRFMYSVSIKCFFFIWRNFGGIIGNYRMFDSS